ncbi:MAG: hypothetical protein HUU15_15640, partial [Candidatus Brocadiae bacterium]|nr:hypothetical protein [Candidatus Brocadiia bacterium]
MGERPLVVPAFALAAGILLSESVPTGAGAMAGLCGGVVLACLCVVSALRGSPRAARLGLAGAVFAAWELATLMLFFETMPREERMGVLTWFNLANAAAIVAGSLAGGAILGGGWGGGGSYPAVFLVSTVLRLLCLPLLLRVREVPRPFRGAGEAALAQSGEAG